MRFSGIASIVFAGFVWMACSAQDTKSNVPDPAIENGEALHGNGDGDKPASTACALKHDSVGDFKEFKANLVRHVHHPGQRDRVISLESTKTERIFVDTVFVADEHIDLDGKPLFTSSVRRYSFSSNIDLVQEYFPPYKGVSKANGSIVDGQILAAVDGRPIVPAPVGTPTSAIQYADGGPAPTVTLDPDVEQALVDLRAQTAAAAGRCTLADPVSSSPEDPRAEAVDPPGHPSDTERVLGCQACRGACFVAAGTCFYLVGTSLACGPFVFFCAVGEIAACTGTEITCLTVCANPSLGGACCPVGCGGESKPNFINPAPPGVSVGCCFSGESCLNRSSGLCCSSGTTACGGKTCCAAGQSCITTGSEAGTCCGGAGDTLCGAHCCHGGSTCTIENGQPACCQGCTTNEQCGPQNTTDQNICVGGCCHHIIG